VASSTSYGSYLGVNAPSTVLYSGANYTNYANLIDLQRAGTVALKVNFAGNTTLGGELTTGGNVCVRLTSCSNALGVSGNIAATGSITGGVASPDYAEEITASDPSISAGDVVAMDPNNPTQVVKSSTAYDPNLLGVISTHPGFITNAIAGSINGTNNPNTNQRPLALAGRVPVKVSTQNGPIAIGDYLTSSSIPGVAMKATQSGPVIGRAMSSYNGTSVGSVIVYVSPGYYNPSNSQTLQANNVIANMLSVNGAINAQSINDSNLLTTNTLKVIGSATIGGNLTIAGGLSVEGMTTVADLTINGHIITSGSTPSVTALSASGTNASVTITGDDTAGTITITTGQSTTSIINGKTVVSGSGPGVGDISRLVFNKQYANLPHILITPNDSKSAGLMVYPDQQSVSGFNVAIKGTPTANTTYSFEYFVVQ
jgi:hypothetical protein